MSIIFVSARQDINRVATNAIPFAEMELPSLLSSVMTAIMMTAMDVQPFASVRPVLIAAAIIMDYISAFTMVISVSNFNTS
jgi:hypothetical protein